MEKTRKQRVLFLCTQNSARSQMAEALLRDYAGDRYEAYSAGVHAAGEIHPYVEEVLGEIGVYMDDQRPKPLGTYFGKMGFNYLIIVCARAEKECPAAFPGVGTRFVWTFDDPRGADVPENERLDKFREVRDEIKARVERWVDLPAAEFERVREKRERRRRERLDLLREEGSAGSEGAHSGRHENEFSGLRREVYARDRVAAPSG